MVKLVVDFGWSYRQAAAKSRVEPKTVSRWVARYRAEGPRGLQDRSSRPLKCPHGTPRAVVRRICRLRRKGRLTMDEISRREGISWATVARILAAHGLNRLSELDPKPVVRRYEHPHPGAMVHLDIKKLGRFQAPGHRVTYSPQTNGKAERFVQTAIREWAYGHSYNTSEIRAAELTKWVHRYDWHRRHGGIAGRTPISRLGLLGATC